MVCMGGSVDTDRRVCDLCVCPCVCVCETCMCVQ